MLHLLASLFFLTLLAAAGTLIVRMVRRESEAILDALARTPAAPAPRPWPTRVRLVGMARPAGIRGAAGRRAVA